MNIPYRIDLMTRLGEYMRSDAPEWVEVKIKAGIFNGWFTPDFVDLSVRNIVYAFLQRPALDVFMAHYEFPETNPLPRTVGVVMAGNIPLVGFHDFLCVFLSGHSIAVKLSSKDNILLKHLVEKLYEWDDKLRHSIRFPDMLKGCDAYIATGSDNSARHFDYYFRKYPHIIRRNRSAAAILTGSETPEELDKLSDDVHLYFGLGCRNVTQLFVPAGYDFIPLINAFKKYLYFFDHSKYRNNYDYQLAIHLLNNKYYMSSGSLLLSENASLFSPVGQVNYQFYEDILTVQKALKASADVQCIEGYGFTSFGMAQIPSLTDFADGVDTMQFLKAL